MAQKRDKHGRFKADHSTRNKLGVTAIGALAAIGAGAFAAIRYGLVDRAKAKVQEKRAARKAPKPDGTLEHPYDFRPDSLVEKSNHNLTAETAAAH